MEVALLRKCGMFGFCELVHNVVSLVLNWLFVRNTVELSATVGLFGGIVPSFFVGGGLTNWDDCPFKGVACLELCGIEGKVVGSFKWVGFFGRSWFVRNQLGPF